MFSCDESLLPVVVVRLPAQWRDADELADALDAMNRCRRHKNVAFVVDARAAARPTSEERALIASAMRDGEKKTPTAVTAFALVTNSALAGSGVLLALRWLAPQAYPMEAFDDLDAAVAWSRSHALR